MTLRLNEHQKRSKHPFATKYPFLVHANALWKGLSAFIRPEAPASGTPLALRDTGTKHETITQPQG